jgi:HEAT repeat protein
MRDCRCVLSSDTGICSRRRIGLSDNPFQQRLWAIVEQTEPATAKDRTRLDIEALLDFGAESFQRVLDLIRDKQAPARLRTTACWVAGRLDDKRAVPALLAAFTDQDVGIRWQAAMSLGMLPSRRAVGPLLAVLRTADDSETRRAAVHALGWCGMDLEDERIYQALVDTLSNGKEEASVRGEAGDALANLGDARAVPALLAAIQDPSAEVRFWAAFALGQLGGPEVLPDLQRLVDTDDAVIPGWWSIHKEALDAMDHVRKRLAWEQEEDAVDQ